MCALRPALAIGLVAACGDDDEDAAKPPAKAPPKPTTFAVAATADGRKKALDFPATVKAGLVTITLDNNDDDMRGAQIMRMEGDHTVDDILKIIRTEGDVKIPAWMQDGGGLKASPGVTASVTQVLAPGRWAIWDDEREEGGPANSERGAKGEFTVTGEASAAELPDAPATVTANDEGEGIDSKYGFTLEGLEAGNNQVRFESTGDECTKRSSSRSPGTRRSTACASSSRKRSRPGDRR